jgi:hypothetical protein
MALSDIFSGTGLSNFLTNNKDNPAYQQAQIQLGNQQYLNDQARQAYLQQLGGVPQQQVAAMDPLRMQGINAQITAAQGPIQQLMNQAQTGAQQFQQGIVPGQTALQNIAGGQGAQFSGQTAQQFGQAMQPGLNASQGFLGGFASGQQTPEFSNALANSYSNFMQPSLLGAQQALNNQANMAWNTGVGNIGGVGGGFASSGRENALGQARQNAASNLGAQQQQLAYNAAQQAAQAGQQGGMLGYQGSLNAANTLGNQNFQSGLYGAQAGQQTGLANLQGQLSAGQTLGNQGLAATQLLPTLANSQLLPGQIQDAAGIALQQQQQNQLNAQYQNQMAQYQNPFSALKNLQAGLGVLGSSTGAPNISTPNNTMQLLNLLGTSVPQLTQGLVGGLGSLFGSGASALGNLFGSNQSTPSGYNNYSNYLNDLAMTGGGTGWNQQDTNNFVNNWESGLPQDSSGTDFNWATDYGQFF